MADADLNIRQAELVLELLIGTGVGAATRESRTAGRKSLAQPFKAGKAA